MSDRLTPAMRQMLRRLQTHPQQYPRHVGTLRALIRRGLVEGPWPFRLTGVAKGAAGMNLDELAQVGLNAESPEQPSESLALANYARRLFELGRKAATDAIIAAILRSGEAKRDA